MGLVTGLRAAVQIFVYTITVSMRATCPVQHIHLDFVSLTVFDNHNVNGPLVEPLLCIFRRSMASL